MQCMALQRMNLHGVVLLVVPCDEACCSAKHIDLACKHDCMSCVNLSRKDEIPKRMSETSSLGSLSGSLSKFSGDSHLLAGRRLRLYDAAWGDSHRSFAIPLSNL